MEHLFVRYYLTLSAVRPPTFLSLPPGQVEKILSVHIPALQPPSSADMEVAPIVQAAALLGVGLLFAGTAQRRMAEILLSSLPGKAGDIRTREAYSFSAGT